jgi:protein-tyrosine phosphatase
MGGRTADAGEPVRVLFVCLGNICRSPTAEGVMRELVEREDMAGRVEVDSAGTGSWHVGSPPDGRARRAARERGIALGGAARQVRPEDFARFDLLLAMDGANQRELLALAPTAEDRERVRLLREFDPAGSDGDLDVPDPYYGAVGGFEEVLDLIEAACGGLLEQIRAGRTGRHAVSPNRPAP